MSRGINAEKIRTLYRILHTPNQRHYHTINMFSPFKFFSRTILLAMLVAQGNAAPSSKIVYHCSSYYYICWQVEENSDSYICFLPHNISGLLFASGMEVQPG
jgi:hypothetical protein